MNKFLVFIVVAVWSHCTFSQDIAIKKHVVSIDGKACLKYVSVNRTTSSLQTLDGKELLKITWTSHPSPGYVEIMFTEERTTLKSTYGYTYKLLIKRLIREGVLVDCKLVSDQVRRFVSSHYM